MSDWNISSVYACEGEIESAMSPLSLQDDAASPDRHANRRWMQCCGGILRESPNAYVKGREPKAGCNELLRRTGT